VQDGGAHYARTQETEVRRHRHLPCHELTRRPLDDTPINYELGLRVQALESLIRAGTSMDADTANSAATETILQATKAAGKGNVVAGNALASLSSAASMDLAELESSERAGLLMEVLQQVSGTMFQCAELRS
jgi:hypothetical protein